MKKMTAIHFSVASFCFVGALSAIYNRDMIGIIVDSVFMAGNVYFGLIDYYDSK